MRTTVTVDTAGGVRNQQLVNKNANQVVPVQSLCAFTHCTEFQVLFELDLADWININGILYKSIRESMREAQCYLLWFT